MAKTLVEFKDVHTYFYTEAGTVKAVNGVSYKIKEGETVCVVGESGCGKSVTALSLMRLIAAPQGEIVKGNINFISGKGFIVKRSNVQIKGEITGVMAKSE